jgi:hypothetical protein
VVAFPAMAESEDGVGALQARILREAAEQLDRGEPPLPADVFNAVADEVELRVDEQAVEEAWKEQGDDEPDPWKAVKALLGL